MNWFSEGGSLIMTLITLCFLMSVSAFAWGNYDRVQLFGRLAVSLGVISFVIKVSAALKTLTIAPDISTQLALTGLRSCLIPVIYGLFVYIIDLILLLFKKKSPGKTLN